MKTGIDIIREERERQISTEGWTPEHDDQHEGGSLADAAACYALHTTRRRLDRSSMQIVLTKYWPFEWSWWKPANPPSLQGRIRELAKAGALIAAEIDRLQRLPEGGGS